MRSSRTANVEDASMKGLALMQMTKVNGEYEMQMTVLVTGFTAPIDSVLVDNKMYVIENRYSGTPGLIYEITFPLPAK
jgi:hypothetical protein